MTYELLIIALLVFLVFGLIKKVAKFLLFLTIIAIAVLCYTYAVEHGILPANIG